MRHVLLDLNELHSIKDAREGWLLNHVNRHFILIIPGTAIRVDLCQCLEQHEPCETLRSKPIVSFDLNVDLLTGLVVFRVNDFFRCKSWQLLRRSSSDLIAALTDDHTLVRVNIELIPRLDISLLRKDLIHHVLGCLIPCLHQSKCLFE